MAFFYFDGSLKVGEVGGARLDVETLARSAQGPCYLYDLEQIEKRYLALTEALRGLPYHIHYAMKANSHPLLLRQLAGLGAGMDTVSGGEIRLALRAGVAAKKIIFSGVGKTVTELRSALKENIGQINVESAQELIRVGELAKVAGTVASVVFRLNPDVSPKTHPYITTGFRENKFGLSRSALPELLEICKCFSSHIKVRGLSMHIGSLLFDLEVIEEAIAKTISVYREMQKQGLPVDRLDVGGGLGIHYETDDENEELQLLRRYGQCLHRVIAPLAVENPGFQLLLEPGRVLVGRCGLLLTEVQYIKKTDDRTFVIVDSGMNHLLRPALYGARHRILPVRPSNAANETVVDVVGPICESSDFFAKGIALPLPKQGDLLAIADTGAYGFAMASGYNAHELPREICVLRGKVVESV